VRKIRVLVVDDSRFMVTLISSILQSTGEVEVVGFALDGQQAVDLAERLVPDVITMDVVMPRMDGIEATKLISTRLGIPIVIFSAHTPQGASMTVDALRAGAVDCIAKPGGERSMSLDAAGAALLERVRDVARSVRTEGPGAITQTRPLPTASQSGSATPSPAVARCPIELVVLGASTGGIQALGSILPRFPATSTVPILVVQHFPQGFTASLAERLASLCSISVAEAQPGQQILPGTILVAPGGKNLEVTPGRRCRVFEDDGPEVLRPSVDITVRSVARNVGPRALVAILSGMGRDGAAGVAELCAAGGRLIVQDPATAAAWGMPKAALEAGKAEAVLPVDRIAPYILDATGGGVGRPGS